MTLGAASAQTAVIISDSMVLENEAGEAGGGAWGYHVRALSSTIAGIRRSMKKAAAAAYSRTAKSR